MSMYKNIGITFFLIIIGITVFAQQQWKHGRLQVTKDGHYLQFEDGAPFFWLGDTGWELFHRLSKEEIERYLQNRKQKGFNVIQAVILAEFDGLKKPNRYGEIPLNDLDPTKPNEKYFELIDWTVQQAMKNKMFMGLLPTWGDKVIKMWGQGPVIFNESNSYIYGKWLGNRYKDFPNIIWILGGDRPPVNDSADKKELWRAMAKGIIEGTNRKAIITYHPSGESSSATFWPNESWLDIQMLQSGHAKKDNPVWEWIKRDRAIVPSKPILDGEPNYEDHPINWNKNNGYFRDYDVRRQCYRSVFSGACGVTYGNQAMWQFYSDREEPVAFPERSWIETLDRPGAFQVGYLRKLIESRSINDRIPDQSIITGGQGEKMEYATAFRGNKYCMIYFPTTKGLTLNLSFLPATQIRIWWYHPGKGQAGKPEVMQKHTTMIFTPPSTETETDWVLIIDDASTKFSQPGK